MTTEENIIHFEDSRNKAMDLWFAARPDVPRTRETERIFEGGYRMAYMANRLPGDRWVQNTQGSIR